MGEFMHGIEAVSAHSRPSTHTSSDSVDAVKAEGGTVLLLYLYMAHL